MVVRLQPVREVPAVARAAGTLSASVDESELADGCVGGLVDLVCRALQGITLYRTRERLAEAGRS